MNENILILTIALLVAGLASLGFVGYRAFAQEAPASWAALIIYYSVTGDFVPVGGTPVTTTTQYKLTYSGPDNWRRDVISSTPVQTRWGSFSRAGAYEQVKGNALTYYEPLGGETSTEQIPAGDMHAPASMFYPISFADLEERFDQQATHTNTGVRVCYNDRCEDNALGWKFARGSRS